MGEANVKNILSKIDALKKLQYLKFEILQFELLNSSYIEKLNKLVEH